MRLSARERAWVGGGLAFLLILGFWLGVYDRVKARHEVLRRQVEARQAEYREVTSLAERFRQLSTSAQGMEGRLRQGRGFSVLAHLEKLAKDSRIRNKQMRAKGGESTRHYREDTVEVRINGVRLWDLVQFLYRIEHPEPRDAAPDTLRVKELRIRPSTEDEGVLDATLQVAAYELLEDV